MIAHTARLHPKPGTSGWPPAGLVALVPLQSPSSSWARVSAIGCLRRNRNSSLRREAVGAPKAEFGSLLVRRSVFAERG